MTFCLIYQCPFTHEGWTRIYPVLEKTNNILKQQEPKGPWKLRIAYSRSIFARFQNIATKQVFLIKVSRRTRHCTGQATPRGVKLRGISSTIDGGSNLLSEIVPAMKSWTYYDRQFCLHWRWKELPSKIKACWPEHTFLVLINHTAVLAHVNLLPRPCHWGH